MTVKWFLHVDQIITVLGSYRRGTDDKNAAGDRGRFGAATIIFN